MNPEKTKNTPTKWSGKGQGTDFGHQNKKSKATTPSVDASVQCGYFETLCAVMFSNTVEMGEFLDKHTFPKLTLGKRRNLTLLKRRNLTLQFKIFAQINL